MGCLDGCWMSKRVPSTRFYTKVTTTSLAREYFVCMCRGWAGVQHDFFSTKKTELKLVIFEWYSYTKSSMDFNYDYYGLSNAWEQEGCVQGFCIAKSQRLEKEVCMTNDFFAGLS